ncbi:MAG: hypothetical protein ACLP7P_08485 [Rhodomicrobium sp.]
MSPNLNPSYRSKDLAPLLGIPDAEAADYSLKGRLNIILTLHAAKRVEVKRGRDGVWLYDVNRHLNLSAALTEEIEQLTAWLKCAPDLPLNDLLRIEATVGLACAA